MKDSWGSKTQLSVYVKAITVIAFLQMVFILEEVE